MDGAKGLEHRFKCWRLVRRKRCPAASKQVPWCGEGECKRYRTLYHPCLASLPPASQPNQPARKVTSHTGLQLLCCATCVCAGGHGMAYSLGEPVLGSAPSSIGSIHTSRWRIPKVPASATQRRHVAGSPSTKRRWIDAPRWKARTEFPQLPPHLGLVDDEHA
jgi:hypothetical protein